DVFLGQVGIGLDVGNSHVRSLSLLLKSGVRSVLEFDFHVAGGDADAGAEPLPRLVGLAGAQVAGGAVGKLLGAGGANAHSAAVGQLDADLLAGLEDGGGAVDLHFTAAGELDDASLCVGAAPLEGEAFGVDLRQVGLELVEHLRRAAGVDGAVVEV